MKDRLKIGLIGEHRHVVEQGDLIGFMGDSVPGVLATARVVWFMEHAARNAILEFMEEDEDSVGSDIEISHTAPTPAGFEVVCTARIIGLDGRKITFEIRAKDQKQEVARALHKRVVVSKKRFAEIIRRKMEG